MKLIKKCFQKFKDLNWKIGASQFIKVLKKLCLDFSELIKILPNFATALESYSEKTNSIDESTDVDMNEEPVGAEDKMTSNICTFDLIINKTLELLNVSIATK